MEPQPQSNACRVLSYRVHFHPRLQEPAVRFSISLTCEGGWTGTLRFLTASDLAPLETCDANTRWFGFDLPLAAYEPLVDMLRNESPIWFDPDYVLIYTGDEPVGEHEMARFARPIA